MDKKFLISSFSWVTITNVITKPLWIFLFIFSARVLGVEQFGTYTYLNSIILALAVLIDSGFDYLLIREITQESNTKFLSTILFTRLVIFVIISAVFTILAVSGLFTYFELLILILLLIFSFSSFLINSVKSTISAFHNFKDYSLILAIEKFSVIFFGLLILLVSSQLLFFVAAIVLGVAAALYISLRILLRNYKINLSLVSWALIKSLLYNCRYLILLNIFFALYFRLDVVLLNYFFNDKVTLGLYGSVHRIIEMYILFPSIIMSAGYPIISKYQQSRDEVNYLLEKLFGILIIISLPIAVIFSFNAYSFNLWLFGSDYKRGFEGLQFIIWTIIPLGFNFVLGNMLVTIKQEKFSVLSLFVGGIFSFIMNIILIPKYSFVGTSITVLMTETLILALNSFFLIRFFNFKILINIYLRLASIILIVIGVFLLMQTFEYNVIWYIIWPAILIPVLLVWFKILKPAYFTEFYKFFLHRS